MTRRFQSCRMLQSSSKRFSEPQPITVCTPLTTPNILAEKKSVKDKVPSAFGVYHHPMFSVAPTGSISTKTRSDLRLRLCVLGFFRKQRSPKILVNKRKCSRRILVVSHLINYQTDQKKINSNQTSIYPSIHKN